jgi:hypothetical protein
MRQGTDERLGQNALARAIRPHDGQRAAARDFKGQPLNYDGLTKPDRELSHRESWETRFRRSIHPTLLRSSQP